MDDINDVVEATWVRDHVVRLRFEDGTTAEVDLRDYPSRGTIFRPLADVSYFKRFAVMGGTLTWPNGADIAPERLHELAVRCRAVETP
jgi:hypothetical protein